MAKSREKKNFSVEEIMRNMNKKAGEQVVSLGLVQKRYVRIPFTSPRMNYCTYGGLPEAKLIEFFGEEGGGKSTTALDAIANFQMLESMKENPRRPLYIDAENRLDPEWAQKLNVDLDNMIISTLINQSAEDIFDFVLEMIETGEIGFVVIDSLASLMSSKELDGDIGDLQYAGISGPLTKFTKRAHMDCKKYNCTLIGINQLRDNLGATWSSTKTPGGRCWRHLCTVRMEFTKGSFINEKGDNIKSSSESPAGNKVLMSMDKNTTCPPNRRGGFYTINYANGIDYLMDLVEVALKYNLVQQSGAWFTIIDPDTGEVKSDKIQGMSNVYAYLRNEENEGVLTFMEQYIDSKI